MQFISTRGQAPRGLLFRCAAGGPGAGWRALSAAKLAAVQRAEIAAFAGKPYQDVAYRSPVALCRRLFHRRRTESRYPSRLCRFRRARHRAAGHRRSSGSQYLLELFHGPTFAFKDIALQILGRLFARALARRGGKRHHRRRHQRRYRLGRHRGAGRPAQHRSLCAASARPGQRSAAPPDDHQRPCQCPQHRAGRQLRRRPGHREGAVRRNRIRARDRPDRRQFHQLRPHRGAKRLLLHRHRGAGQARAPSWCPPAISATFSPARRPCAWGWMWRGW